MTVENVSISVLIRYIAKVEATKENISVCISFAEVGKTVVLPLSVINAVEDIKTLLSYSLDLMLEMMEKEVKQ